MNRKLKFNSAKSYAAALCAGLCLSAMLTGCADWFKTHAAEAPAVVVPPVATELNYIPMKLYEIGSRSFPAPTVHMLKVGGTATNNSVWVADETHLAIAKLAVGDDVWFVVDVGAPYTVAQFHLSGRSKADCELGIAVETEDSAIRCAKATTPDKFIYYGYMHGGSNEIIFQF